MANKLKKEHMVYMSDDMYLPIHYKGIVIKQPYYSGDGNLNIMQLEQLCKDFKEYTHQQAIIKQNCMQHIVELKFDVVFDNNTFEKPSDDIEYILEETKDAYMRDNFSDDHWKQIAEFLVSIANANKEGVACIMNSKHMRWSGEHTFNSFKEYFMVDRNDVLHDLLNWSVDPY